MSQMINDLKCFSSVFHFWGEVSLEIVVKPWLNSALSTTNYPKYSDVLRPKHGRPTRITDGG